MRDAIAKIFDKIIRLLLKLSGYLAEETHYINGADTLPPPLTPEEEAHVFSLIEAGDFSARDHLITHNLRLVVYIARKFENSGVGIEDLISIGTIGLIKAVNTFCPSRKIKLATYSSRCIENEILMYLRKNAPSRNEMSIDEPLNVDWDGNELLLSDILGSDPDIVHRNIEQEAEKNLLMECISHLSEREQFIMRLRFGINGNREHTQKEVADLLGISQSYISRLEKKIIKRLKKDFERAC
ncbi:MAG: RNA polymerase sporulation sigma factor SigE [Oscillospiraceae bacterium]|nr:RNA polymerase sporulation sigma factor SigE [Oscillospiraceae bacterium]